MASVVEPYKGQIVLPDHKLTLCAVDHLDEAYYLCAMLNSSLTAFAVSSFAIQTQISTNVFNYLNVPKYDSEKSLHLELSTLSQAAHEAAAKGDTTKVKNKIEPRIDELAAQVWGLTHEELKEIQESLAELK